MHIHVNGRAHVARPEATVAELLLDLDIKPERVAVELNLEILDRGDFGRRVLQEGDRIEILGFIGGGGVRQEKRLPSIFRTVMS